MRARKTDRATRTLYTIGHSTRTTRELLDLLRAHGVEQVVDVRTIPRSRHNPQFNRPALSRSLHAVKIRYRHMKALGGLRHARLDSVNLGWRNASFRGYADHIESAEFSGGLDELLEFAGQLRTTLMCAEAVWWRCHRALIADVLRVRGIEVVHILDPQHCVVHPYTSPARIVEGRLSYAR